jgi:hypothetical protein
MKLLLTVLPFFFFLHQLLLLHALVLPTKTQPPPPLSPKRLRPQRVKGMNIWYIDGYNVLGHSGTPKDVTVLTEKLQQIQPATNTVILVLDGKKVSRSSSSSSSSTDTNDVIEAKSTPSVAATTTKIEVNGTFQKVVLGDGLLADDYILNEIQSLCPSDNTRLDHEQQQQQQQQQQRRFQKSIIQVVTADRQLRNEVLNIKQPIKVRGVVNPVTFWKRYLPRLCGMKLPAPAPSSMQQSDIPPV